MSFEVLLIIILALIFLLQWLDGLDRERRKNREAAAKSHAKAEDDKKLRESLEDLLKQLIADPNNASLYKKIVASMDLQEDDPKTGKASAKTGKAYAIILDLLTANPTNIGLRRLALDAGRANCRKKFDGVVSAEEEQRIVNDINMCSGVGPQFN